jgi:hypothetical protein
MLFEAWATGTAFQCVFHQPVIDGFVVAYFGDLDEPFDISKLFLIPWQTKAKIEAAGSKLSEALAAPFLTKPDSDIRHKPWTVVLLMDLAATSAFGHRGGPHCQLTYGQAKRPTGKKKDACWMGYAQGKEIEGDRYCLNIRGHREHDYPVIQGLQSEFDQLFQRTLGCARTELLHFATGMENAMQRFSFD